MATSAQATEKGKQTSATAKPVVWFEVVGKDGPGLQRFYTKLFDWQIADAGDGSGYGLVSAAEKGIGGGIGPTQDGGRVT